MYDIKKIMAIVNVTKEIDPPSFFLRPVNSSGVGYGAGAGAVASPDLWRTGMGTVDPTLHDSTDLSKFREAAAGGVGSGKGQGAGLGGTGSGTAMCWLDGVVDPYVDIQARLLNYAIKGE